MTCPRCDAMLELTDDKTRGYCRNPYCHALVVIVPTASDMHHHGELAAE